MAWLRNSENSFSFKYPCTDWPIDILMVWKRQAIYSKYVTEGLGLGT
jgi:hypothetical protein